MVAVNAEERDWNLCQRIFASPVSPIPVVVQSDVTQDNESAFGLDLLPLTERDDPLKPTVRIACQVDLVFWMQQLTHNSGRFGVDVLPYLKTDHALYAAMGDTHKRYRLDMEHNNWWECFVYTPEGEFHDMMWALDSDHIFEGVEVVLSAMDSVMKDITENKERIEYGKDSAFYC